MMASCSRPAKETEEKSTNGPNWLELPTEVTTNIFQKLSVEEIVMSASQVCSLWWNICKNPFMWRTIDMSHMTNLPNYPSTTLAKICRYGIERSCGHLEDIGIGYFASDDLLNYIAESTSHLRRLRLRSCPGISDEGMREVAKKLPQLEELDVSFSNLSKNSLEAIGQSCPFLKTLKLEMNSLLTYNIVVYDTEGEAFAIGKTMSELRHLRIWTKSLSNKGLLAILDGCPLLECLDLQHCLKVDLSGGLWKRCHEQIKEIWLPIDFDFEDKVSGDYSDDDIVSDYRRVRDDDEDSISRLIDSIGDSDFGFKLKCWFAHDDDWMENDF